MVRRCWPLSVLVLSAACGSDDRQAHGAHPDGSASDSGSSFPDAGSGGSSGASSDAAADALPLPMPESLDPCAAGECWTAPAVGGLCGSRNIDQDFASGQYDAHRYLLLAPAGVDVDLDVASTGGSWTPRLVVHDSDGVTVHDGEKSLSSAALAVSSDGPGSLRVNAPAGMHLAVFVTSAAAIPTEASYSLEVKVGCSAQAPLSVRGVELGLRQELWVRYIGRHVVPALRGSESERLETAAVVTWWSLKEGVLDVANPLSYSNCSFPPDQHIGPVEICPDPDNAWQVGLSAVQSAWKTLANVEALALEVHPGKSVTDVLVAAASAAGFGKQTALGQTIASSEDRLRMSWLLRDSAVGFEAQYPVVHSECFVQQKSWCFGSGWPASASFAPSQAAAQQAVADLKSIFQTLAP